MEGLKKDSHLDAACFCCRNAVLPTPPVFDVLQSQNEKVYKEMLTEQQQLQQMSLVSHHVLEIVDVVTFSALDGHFRVLGF